MHSPKNTSCHAMLHNGSSKPFSTICQGKKAEALVMACTTITRREWDHATVPCRLSMT